MKSKNYWEREGDSADPFELPKRIARGTGECREVAAAAKVSPTTVRYIWIHLTEHGLVKSYERPEADAEMDLEGWLNVIDESASLGAEWMMVDVGASFSKAPYIWRVCQWAQEVHGLRVGLHLESTCLSEDDLEQLTHLEPAKTFVLADKDDLDALWFLRASGVQLCEANVTLDERAQRCTKPEEIACVGPDGHLFSCGLVLGDKEFALGDSRDRHLSEVMKDDTLPHAIPDTTVYPVRGCDACPPVIAGRALGALSD